MKKYFLSFFLLVVSCAVFAQEDTTTIFSNPGYNNDPLRSKWERKVEQKDSLWQVSLYDQKNNLREKVSYAGKNLEVRKGPYVFYENGKVREEGSYGRGYRTGKWRYYDDTNKLIEQATYLWDKLNGKYQSFWDNGNIKKEGSYALGVRIGNWKMFYKDKKPALTEEYDEKGKLLNGVYFDEEGKSVKKTDVVYPISYPGGWKAFNEFVSKEIKYPVNAYKNKIEGTVKLAFTITKGGRVADIQVIESPNEDLTREAIRVLQLTKDWLQATELGEFVTGRAVVPVKFVLNR